MNILPYVEWFGCITALGGALLLALNFRWSGYGWWLFLVSNGAWFFYGSVHASSAMMVNMAGLTITSLIGIKRWWSAGHCREEA